MEAVRGLHSGVGERDSGIHEGNTMTMLGKECEECGYIGLPDEDFMCPKCDGNMLLVDLDGDPLTRLRAAQWRSQVWKSE